MTKRDIINGLNNHIHALSPLIYLPSFKLPFGWKSRHVWFKTCNLPLIIIYFVNLKNTSLKHPLKRIYMLFFMVGKRWNLPWVSDDDRIYNIWLIDLLFYVPLENVIFINMEGSPLPVKIGKKTCSFWAVGNLYPLSTALSRDLGFWGLVRRTAPFSRLVQQTRGI